MPTPTRSPAARSSASGAMPQPRSAFERGQCATATSCAGEQRDLVGVDLDAVRGDDRAGRAGPPPARRRMPRLAVGGRRGGRRTAATAPRPRRSQSSSSWLSLRCVATGTAEVERTPRRPPSSRCRARAARRRAGRAPRAPGATYVELLLELRERLLARPRRTPRGRRSRAGRARRTRGRLRRRSSRRRPS